MNLLVRGGRLLDPASGRDGRYDLLIEGGRVAEVAPDLSHLLPEGSEPRGIEVLEASGLLVLPGLVDIHAHLRTPGQSHKETLETGTRAAAAGGFTQVVTLANTVPVLDDPLLVEALAARVEREAVVRVHVAAAVTKGQMGRELAPLGALAQAGACAVSDDGRPIADAGVMRRALEYAKGFGLVLLDHAEDPGLAGEGVVHEGPVAAALGLPGLPSLAESVAVARDVALAGLTGARLHVMHVSARASLEPIRRAKEEGFPVTAEVTPHHLALTVAEVARFRYDARTKVNPPLRDEEDREALVEALAEGLLDCIATDHAPHAADEKDAPYRDAPFGISGFETAFALVHTELVRPGRLPLPELVRRMTVEPARVLGLRGGRLAPGDPGDLALFDLEARWRVEPERFESRGRNTPLVGRELLGRCRATVVGGRVVWRDEA